jgi:hypothetical protein
MRTALELLSQTQVAAPCSADWNTMKGDDYSRFCGHCQKNVYNLSTLTIEAAVNLIREKEGNLCGRFYRRADGTMLTADCPVGVNQRVRRRSRLAALAASVFSLFGFGGCAKFDDGGSTTTGEQPPVRQENNNVVQPAGQQPIGPPIAGGLCAPPEMLRKNASEVLPQPRELESD